MSTTSTTTDLADALSDRMASALRLASETSGVSTHGNVADAMERRRSEWGGGTSITPTHLGYQVARILWERERDAKLAEGRPAKIAERALARIDSRLAI